MNSWNPWYIWLMIIGMGLVTYFERVSFILLLGSRRMPAWFERLLRFVPPAVLAALVLPAVVYRDDVIDVSFNNVRLLATLCAALAAWLSKSILVTIIVGMSALWLLQYLLG